MLIQEWAGGGHFHGVLDVHKNRGGAVFVALCWATFTWATVITMCVLMQIVQAFYGQKLVNLPQIATEANSTDMIS